MNSYPVFPPHTRMYTAPTCSIQLSFPSPRSGTEEAGGRLNTFCGLRFARRSQTWFSAWPCEQACWHRCRVGSSVSNRHCRGRLWWMKSRCELTACLCGGQPVLLSPTQSCWLFFSCFLQTSSLSLRHEIALESFVSFGKIKTFKYAWICAGNLSG